jgi:hypothetical protein
LHVHAASTATAKCVGQVFDLALLSTGASLLVLCIARPELSDHHPQWPVTLRLGPLPPDAVEALLPASIGSDLRERIAHAAGGNPLFVTEMLLMKASAGDEVVVPPTLKALLAARLDQLEASGRYSNEGRSRVSSSIVAPSRRSPQTDSR